MKTTQHYVPSFLRFLFNKLKGQTLMKVTDGLKQYSHGWKATLGCTITGKEYLLLVIPKEEWTVDELLTKGGLEL